MDFDDDDAESLQTPPSFLDAIRAEASQLTEQCPFVRSITPVLQSSALGVSMAEGWKYRVVLEGPAFSPYDLGLITVELELDEDWPDTVPFVRFTSIVYHSQVGDVGEVKGCFYAALPGPHLRDCMNLLHAMLREPLPDAPTLDAVLHAYATHPTDCVCSGFPLSYGVFVTMPSDEQEVVLRRVVQGFIDRIGPAFQHKAAIHRRRMQVIESYTPRHVALFSPELAWSDDAFSGEFIAALRGGESALRALMREECPGVYSFPLLSAATCRAIVDEMKAFEASDLPKTRPNSMNNYGLILNDIGMEHSLTSLLHSFLKPVAALLYPDDGGRTVDHHHSFLVQYKPDADRLLDMHVDDSEVTFNVNVLDAFEGSALTFCGRLQSPDHRQRQLGYKHELGRAVVHAGRHRHGADTIVAGERVNLIVWCRSSSLRLHPEFKSLWTRVPESSPPASVCLSRTHDPDFEEWHTAASAATATTTTTAPSTTPTL